MFFSRGAECEKDRFQYGVTAVYRARILTLIGAAAMFCSPSSWPSPPSRSPLAKHFGLSGFEAQRNPSQKRRRARIHGAGVEIPGRFQSESHFRWRSISGGSGRRGPCSLQCRKIWAAIRCRSAAAVLATLGVYMVSPEAKQYILRLRSIVQWDAVWEGHLPYGDRCPLHFAMLHRIGEFRTGHSRNFGPPYDHSGQAAGAKRPRTVLVDGSHRPESQPVAAQPCEAICRAPHDTVQYSVHMGSSRF
jgi:hypothetical protein